VLLDVSYLQDARDKRTMGKFSLSACFVFDASNWLSVKLGFLGEGVYTRKLQVSLILEHKG